MSTDAARRLVNEVGRLKRGAVDDTEEAPASTLLYEISSRELALLGLVSLDLRFVPILTVAVPVVVPSLSRFIVTDPVTGFILAAPLGIIALIVLSVVTSGAAAIANYYGFRLSRANGDLRYERGLLQRYDGTIPLDKVQTLTIRENLVQRLVDHATLGVETAGYAPGQGTTLGSEAAVPLAPKDRVVSLAQTIEPFGDPTFERPPKRARQRYAVRYTLALLALTGVLFAVIRFSGFEIGWWVPLLGIPLTPVAAHYQWKNRGYALTDDYVLTQAGFWVRTTKIVPYYRVQTVATSASIFQRYRDLPRSRWTPRALGASSAATPVPSTSTRRRLRRSETWSQTDSRPRCERDEFAGSVTRGRGCADHRIRTGTGKFAGGRRAPAGRPLRG
ncbi:PH domain-containing protein [Haladaptatus sp. GCM10025707]|uniref:PH domain-containing protein n=1 Tax=Haladaptatus sp. GCM10025707 TaxID=3252658 RepID=UPI0036176093